MTQFDKEKLKLQLLRTKQELFKAISNWESKNRIIRLEIQVRNLELKLK